MSTWTPIDPLPQALSANEQRAKELLDQGKTLFQIAYKLHISCEACRDMIFEIRKKECLMAGKPKLSADEQAEIVEKYKSGETARDLAAQYDVSHGTVENIVKRAGATRKRGSKPKKKTQINEDFEQAVDSMIAEREAAEAEKKSANAEAEPEPEKIPDVIWHACDDKISMINLDIETREQRIAELKEEIEQLRAEREQIRAWMEGHA